jgi:branched-chain amino acid transport system substrate-binding protein
LITFNFKHHAKALIIALIALVLLIAIGFKSGLFSTEEPIYIAVVSTLSGKHQANGKSLVKAVQLNIDIINQTGGVNGKPVTLQVFDDQGRPEQARKIAQKIVENDQVLAVLGHYFSYACIAAGEIYQNAKIPIITPSCTADKVTQDNEWYFRMVPNNKFEGTFLANYAKRVLKHNRVTIVYDDQDDYSLSLVNGFENPFLGLNGEIKQKWVINAKADNTHEQIETTARAFLGENPGLIFLALQAHEARKLILSLKRKGLHYPILGGDALGQTSFAASFNKYPEEQAQPGFFTDGMYAAAPTLLDIASEQTQRGINQYVRRYEQKPTWVAISAYQASAMLIEAMKTIGINGYDRRAERQKIRDYFATRTSIENALAGINGPFYFDHQGNAVQPLAVGLFQEQELISALIQFQPVPSPDKVARLQKEINQGHIVIIDGRYLYKTRMVYTGIDFNEVTHIDSKNSTYKIDFYLWFRYKKGIEANDIEFTDAVSKGFETLQLGKPLIEETLENEVIYQLYRVNAEFKEAFNFRDYPFDVQSLAIRFRHKHLTRENLIYVADLVGIGETTDQGLMEKLKRNHVFAQITDWRIKTVHLFSDIQKKESTLGNPYLFGKADASVEFLRFNAVIEIQRDILSFITKNLLPLLFLVGISYLIMFLPFEQVSVTAVSGTLVAVAFFHLSLANGLPSGIGYAVVLDYGFYVIYGLIIFQLLLVVIGQRKDIKENSFAVQRLVLTGRIVYPIIFLICGSLLAYFYGDEDLLDFYSPPVIAADADSSIEQFENSVPAGEVVLTLGSWRTEDIDRMNRILNVFNAQHPNITVKFQPILKWIEMIRFQLKHGTAPDLFYLKSFSRSRPLFEAGYLEPLNDLPGLKENFTEQARLPWTGKKGEQYALPFMAVSHGIYYNQAIFKKLNLPLPTTWEELIRTAEAIKAAGFIPFANGLANEWAVAEQIFMNLAPNFIGGRKGRLAYETGQRCFNAPHTVALFEAIAEIGPYLPPSPESLSAQMSREDFVQGKAAMLMSGSWDIIELEKENSDFNWSVFAVPAPFGQAEHITYHSDFGVALNAASKHKAEAKIFLEWLTQPETAALFSYELPGFFPMHEKRLKIDNEQAQTFLDLNQGRGTDVRWAYPKLMEGIPNGQYLMYKTTLGVIGGKLSPQEAADSLQKWLAQWFEPAQRCHLSQKTENVD